MAPAGHPPRECHDAIALWRRVLLIGESRCEKQWRS